MVIFCLLISLLFSPSFVQGQRGPLGLDIDIPENSSPGSITTADEQAPLRESIRDDSYTVEFAYKITPAGLAKGDLIDELTL